MYRSNLRGLSEMTMSNCYLDLYYQSFALFESSSGSKMRYPSSYYSKNALKTRQKIHQNNNNYYNYYYYCIHIIMMMMLLDNRIYLNHIALRIKYNQHNTH